MNNIIIGSLNRRTVMGYSAHCDCFIASPAPFINIQTYLLSKGWLDRAEGHSPPPQSEVLLPLPPKNLLSVTGRLG